MRQLFGVILSVSLVIPLPGIWSWLHFEKQEVRDKARDRIEAGSDKESYVVLGFAQKETKTRLRWHHSREFEFNGQMYDIVETHERGDSVFYFCYTDHKETALNKQLKDLFRKKHTDPSSRRAQQQISDFLKSLYHPTAIANFSLLTYHSLLTTRNPEFPHDHADEPPPIPPPEII